jgi:hypothetical protein
MSKRARENSTPSLHSELPSHLQHGDGAHVDSSPADGESASSLKKVRTFMATLVSNSMSYSLVCPDKAAVGLQCMQSAQVKMRRRPAEMRVLQGHEPPLRLPNSATYKVSKAIMGVQDASKYMRHEAGLGGIAL